MKYKAIIFDMDGTIVTTEHIWGKSNELLLQHYGIPYTDEMLQEIAPRVQGLSGHKSCQIIIDIAQIPHSLVEVMDTQRMIAHKLYHDGIGFIDGFVDFQKKLVEHQVKHGIATNACDKTVAITDEKLNLKQFFGNHIYGVSCVGNVCKPDPAIFLHAAEQLQVDPADCIVFEDSAHGVNAARKAGMYCIGIATSPDKNQLRDAHRVIDTYHGLDVLTLRDEKV